MNSITLDGVTFRWDGQEVLVTTAASQQRITGGNAARLLDFLQVIQQDLYTAEQARELPTWAHQANQFANGQVSVGQPLRLTSGTIITSNQEEK